MVFFYVINNYPWGRYLDRYVFIIIIIIVTINYSITVRYAQLSFLKL